MATHSCIGNPCRICYPQLAQPTNQAVFVVTDPIKALIAAARATHEAAASYVRRTEGWVIASSALAISLPTLEAAITAAEAAAEARPEPKPVRHCAKCGKPENAHDVRHPFVGTGEPSSPEPAAEPFGPTLYQEESFDEALGNLDESLSHAVHVGPPEAFRGAIMGCMHYLRDAVEALAREVRRG